MSARSVSPVLVLLALASAPALSAQAAPAAPAFDSLAFAALSWREIGIFRGGRTVAVAGSGARPMEYWMGTTGGGVFKTTDGGNTWLPASDKYFGGTIGAIGVSESKPDIVYVGTGEYAIRGNVSHGDGVWKTTDAGKTWTSVGLAETRQISRVRVHPSNPDIVYVAAQGHAFGPNPERGIYKTTDGGKTWTKVLFKNDSTGASDLAMDPSNPEVLYAAFWQVERRPWALSSGGAGGGIWKTTDGGAHWTELTHNPGLPKGLLGNIGITVSAAKPSRVWALIEADSGGVYRSDDAGATWKRVNSENKLRQRAWYYMKIFADTKDSNTVWAVNTGLYKSKDGGKTFEHIQDPHGDNHDLWIAPNDNQRLIESSDGGGTVSFNGGKTWTDQDYATAQFYHVTTTNHFPYRVCGAQQDNSGVCGPSRWPGGIDRGQWYDVAGESGYIVALPDSPDVTFGGDNSGFLGRLDHRTGFFRMVSPWPDSPDGHAASEGKYRFQWTAPQLVSPHDPHTLYIGANVLFKSTDQGQTWAAISPDLTRHDPRTMGPSGGPITLDQTTAEYYATIFAIDESPVQAGVIWTGSDDGLLNVTRDGGKTWTNVTPRDFGDFTRVSIIEASHWDAGTAYVAANRYQLEDYAPYIWKTTDYGATWTRLVTGIPATEFVRVVREDPVRKGLLFAGTERGVYVSFDDGQHWQTLRRNLPIVPVHDLAIKEGDLIAATHGRSFWILDNISTLEQMTPASVAAEAQLFKPRDAYRVEWGGDFSSAAHPVGKNPPSGAMFYYWLKGKNQEVAIDVLDSAGHVIRSFTSKQDSLTAVDSTRTDSLKHWRTDSLTKAGVTDSTKRDSILGTLFADTLTDENKPWPHRPPAAPRVPNKPGMNLFVWDMHYPDAQNFWGNMDIATQGPLALPGGYQVRFRAAGADQTESFHLLADPRSSASAADLREQFAFLEQVRDTVNAVTRAIVRLRNARAQLEDRLAALPAKGAARTQAQALWGKLRGLEDSLYQTRLRADEDNLVFPPRAAERLSTLLFVAGGGDYPPTAADRQVFQYFAPDIQRALLLVQGALDRDLAAVNSALRAAKLAAVTPGSGEIRPPKSGG
ncbi:MAG TPA: glycosyl hydrolase [Gemmatimonadales bacterium]|nr:glycosyl hydrolase [Gemmatimonadales bacterium]